jgi:hypothetical protein
MLFEQTVSIFQYSSHWLLFTIHMDCVLCEIRTDSSPNFINIPSKCGLKSTNFQLN